MEQVILTLLILVSLYLFAQPVLKRLRLVAAGKGSLRIAPFGKRLLRFVSEVLLQSRTICQRLIAGTSHALVFWGFLSFLLASFHHFASKYGWHPLGQGGFYRVYSTIVAVFAALVIVGITSLAFRRFVLRPRALGKLSWTSGLVAFFIEVLMLTYLLGYFNLLTSTTAQGINWWIHSIFILAFLVLIPHSKHLHLFLSPFTTFLKDFELARIRPLDFEKEEFGVDKLSDFGKHSVLSAFTCVECGRCFDHCPANQTGKALNPKQLMLDLRAGFLKNPEETAVGPVIQEEILWQCTTCGACTYQCPVGIDQVIPIIEMRRGRVAAAEFPSTLRALFDNLEKSGNPWKYPSDQASEFIESNKMPSFKEQDVLYWMGCMGRFDFYYQKVSLAFTQVLNAAGVSWGILKNEKCTGDAARRAGNELVFQMLAEHNIEILNKAAPRLIVTTCPHCLRTLTEYKEFGLNAETQILHHSEFLAQLLQVGKLSLSKAAQGSVAYHDACYLSRYIGPAHIRYPRQVISKTGSALAEPKRRRERSFCCGAGGGLLFTEETIGERVNHNRVKELLVTGATTVGTACPFCQLMLRDGLKDLDKETIVVKDIAELVAGGLSS
jgi:Fe-S oxidoreductase